MREDSQGTALPGFEYEEGCEDAALTARAGAPILAQAFRGLGVAGGVARKVRVKQRERGLSEADYVESFLILNAVGGECLDDFAGLREDRGLAELLGHGLPSPEAARKFLYSFHLEEAAGQQAALPGAARVRAESGPLAGLAEANRGLIAEVARRSTPQRVATVDLDGTVIQSHKREAAMTYQGVPGYQPLVALWAEMNLALADEFRDGNVPAQMAPLAVAKRAFAALPASVAEHCFRGGSACYEGDLLRWLADPRRPGAPEGAIGFAVSARMTKELRTELTAAAEEDWRVYREDPDAIVECAELSSYAGGPAGLAEPLRWLGVRIRPRQGELFPDGCAVRCFAVVSNIWQWRADQLLAWHREKAGSIEALHHVVKNELAGGVLPCGRFGANAAWFRMALLTHNLLEAVKRVALPPELLTARPKRLRFLIFNTVGQAVHHARRVRCRVAAHGWRGRMALLAPALA